MKKLALISLLLSCAATPQQNVDKAIAVLRDLGVKGDLMTGDGKLNEATSIVWSVYKGDFPVPVILVATEKDFNCTDPNSGTPGFNVLLASGIECRNGYTVLPWVCSVSWHGEPWSKTALAHEMYHAWQTRHGIIDPDHKRPEWKTAVPAANAELESVGL